MTALDVLATRVPDYALPRPFYTDAEIHHLWLERCRPGWGLRAATSLARHLAA